MNGRTTLIMASLPGFALILGIAGAISLDVAISFISWMFIAALVPGIVENYRKKLGWNKTSTAMTASGLIAMGTMFLFLGLIATGLATLASGMTWVVLMVQAFKYPKPSNTSEA